MAEQKKDILDSQWRSLRLLLNELDQDIASLYDEAGMTGMRTRFVGPIIELARHQPLTIGDLAARFEVTHSAMSQTVAAMRKAGYVISAAGAAGAAGGDARTRRIRLSKRARDVVPFLEAEWSATEASIAELETDIPYPLSRVVEDIHAALRQRPFRQRLDDNLRKALSGRLG